MKIITTYHEQNAKFMGVIASLAIVHPETQVWIKENKPAFDMMDEIHPDVLICTSSDFTPDLILALQEYNNVDVILFGAAHPPQIRPILQCIDNHNIADKLLENIDIPYLKIYPAANTAQFNNGMVEYKYSSDIFYMSSLPVQQYGILSTLEHLVTTQFRFKLCGSQVLPFPQYLGKTTLKEATNMMVSSKIVIDFNEHIMLDAAFNKAFCLSNVKTDLYPSFTTYEELLAQVEHFVADEKHRQSYIKKAHKFAKQNTYMHRLVDICEKIGLSDLAKSAEAQL